MIEWRLSGVRIAYDPNVDWNETYQILKRELDEGTLRFHNPEDNVTVLQLSIAMGYTPEDDSISAAAEAGLVRILRFLLDEGSINPNSVSVIDDYPPLTLAADNAQVECVRLLLADPRVDPNNAAGDTTALVQACSASISDRRQRYIDVVQLLLKDRRADPHWYDSLALSSPTARGDVYEIVQLLLDDGRADPNDDDGLPFIETVESGAVRCLTLLLRDPRTRPWVRDGRALSIACERYYPDVVKLLLKDGRIDPNSGGESALHAAISLGNNDKSGTIIKLLLADDRTYAAAAGNTPLGHAIRIHNVIAVRLLLANPEVLEELDKTALSEAEQQPFQSREVVNLVRMALETKSHRD